MDTQNKFDVRFGVRADPDSKNWLMGSKNIDFDKQDYIHVDDQMFRGTVGLFELIFKKIPDTKVLTNYDKEVYKKLLELTNAHFQLYNPNLQLASSSGVKYNTIIKPLFKPEKKQTLPRKLALIRGSKLTSNINTVKKKKEDIKLLPVTNNRIDYLYWDDPNELVNRLLLLHSSQAAGNNNHLVEIAAIEEELREGGYIQ